MTLVELDVLGSVVGLVDIQAFVAGLFVDLVDEQVRVECAEIFAGFVFAAEVAVAVFAFLEVLAVVFAIEHAVDVAVDYQKLLGMQGFFQVEL